MRQPSRAQASPPGWRTGAICADATVRTLIAEQELATPDGMVGSQTDAVEGDAEDVPRRPCSASTLAM